uniref:Uncharacterized protein n=1 Tax=Brassica oleracea TaxID=3712 RepID=A0A3P6FRY5_BRAOL|nr:unnamed protein product [Brassica oleracea]
MGLYKFFRSGRTQLCRNWVLVLVVPEQTVRLHQYWLTRAAEAADQ